MAIDLYTLSISTETCRQYILVQYLRIVPTLLGKIDSIRCEGIFPQVTTVQ